MYEVPKKDFIQCSFYLKHCFRKWFAPITPIISYNYHHHLFSIPEIMKCNLLGNLNELIPTPDLNNKF